jgi:ADP-heptose:LPS heptosyltransferase
MSSRLGGRLAILLLGLLKSLARKSFDPQRSYRRILVAHHLLLGDTILLTPMLAKLRQRYPDAEIWMTVSPPFATLYAGHPYGVKVMAYHPRDFATLKAWLKIGSFDLALVPGDTRYTWLARALGAECIIALDEPNATWKNWQVDKHAAWPEHPCTLAEIFSNMVDGQEPAHYHPDQWPVQQCDLRLPAKPYCVMHISARNLLRRWPVAHWKKIAENLRSRGFHIVWSAGPGDDALLEQISTAEGDMRFPGTLALPELRQLITGANLLVTVETGIAHLCRLTGTPSIVIFGQGNPNLHGNEPFWGKASPMQPVFIEDIQCRDQTHVFGQNISWVRRCDRSQQQCSKPICIERIEPAQVDLAANALLGLQ